MNKGQEILKAQHRQPLAAAGNSWPFVAGTAVCHDWHFIRTGGVPAGLVKRIVDGKPFRALGLDVVSRYSNNVGAVASTFVLLATGGVSISSFLEEIRQFTLTRGAFVTAVDRHCYALNPAAFFSALRAVKVARGFAKMRSYSANSAASADTLAASLRTSNVIATPPIS